MCPCAECGKEIDVSAYLEVADLRRGAKPNLVHIECASSDNLKERLLLFSRREIEFFQAVSSLAENPTLEGIKAFERKYGDYEELSWGTSRDHQLAVAAYVAELRKRFSTRT